MSAKWQENEDAKEDPHILSREQEQALAENENLSIGFHLVLNGWHYDRIIESFKWSEPEVIKILTTLDKLKLIGLQPENKVTANRE